MHGKLSEKMYMVLLEADRALKTIKEKKKENLGSEVGAEKEVVKEVVVGRVEEVAVGQVEEVMAVVAEEEVAVEKAEEVMAAPVVPMGVA